MRHIIACILILAGISPVFGGTPTVTNLTSQAFTVSWTTQVPEMGWVEYGTTAALGMIAYDNRGQGVVDDIHYVTIDLGSLPASYTYTYQYHYAVISGGQKTGQGTITPGCQPQQGSDPAYGSVPSISRRAIVYAIIKDANGTGTIGTSSTLSTLINDSGEWYINLASSLTTDGQQYFQYSQGDELILRVDAAGDGIAFATATIGTLTNVGTITLIDTIAPPDTPVFQPSPQNSRVSLNWDMPAISSGVSGILILRSQQGYPQAAPTAGIAYAVGSNTGDAAVVCVSTNTTTWTDESLTNNTTYYYRIFTYDGAYNYSPGIFCQATPVVNLDNAAIYPNPWRTGDGAIYFDKLKANTHICIYNIAGELVHEAEASGGTYSWPPKDIASGIYLYLLKSDGGCVRTGKLGIVR